MFKRTNHLDCNHLYLDRPNSYEDTGAWNSAAARSEPAHQDTWTSSSSAYRPDPGWGIAPVPKPQGGIIFIIINLFFKLPN